MIKNYLSFFWNVERFFSISGGPVARSLGITESSNWNEEAYNAKLLNVCAVLNQLTKNNEIAFGAFVEIENKEVLDDIKNKMGWDDLVNLDQYTNSQGLDGYDITLLYSKKIFKKKPVRVKSISLNNNFLTRDILEVELELRTSNQKVCLFIVHWPSRVISEGRILRLAHAYYLKNLVSRSLQFRREELLEPSGVIKMPQPEELMERWNKPILIMGDFNDEPFNESVHKVLDARYDPSPIKSNATLSNKALKNASTYLKKKVKLFNPCWSLIDIKKPIGTFYRNGSWRIYDQVMVNHGCLVNNSLFKFKKDSISVFRRESIKFEDKTTKMTTRNGFPKKFSTQTKQGVSDHFPITFSIEINN